ncbi:IS4 family transposase, partial [Schleiferilactobacillus harbinensis]|uniref:transposase n=1 Tax=Schleiferilactobacillus harbinensis TaxID=304207 RepID=UPI0021A7E57B
MDNITHNQGEKWSVKKKMVETNTQRMASNLLQPINAVFQIVDIHHLTRAVNYRRRSPIPFEQVLHYELTNVKFAGKSLYRADKPTAFSQRTVENVLKDGRINWFKLTCGFLKRLLINAGFIADNRFKLAFVLDDTLMPRPQGKKTELLANGYDHDSGQYKRSFRGLTLGLSDGQSFFPVGSALMSSKSVKNRVGAPAKTVDQRSNAGRRRVQAMKPMNVVAVELLQQALACGLHAGLVLFDSWFGSPKMFRQLTEMGLAGLGMVKRTKKVYYRYRQKLRSVKGIYETLRRTHHHTYDHYLYSVQV